MNNKWTPILAAPLMLVAAGAFGLAVFRVGGRMGYPLWVAAVAGLLATISAWSGCRGRYDRLTSRQRQGGPRSPTSGGCSSARRCCSLRSLPPRSAGTLSPRPSRRATR